MGNFEKKINEEQGQNDINVTQTTLENTNTPIVAINLYECAGNFAKKVKKQAVNLEGCKKPPVARKLDFNDDEDPNSNPKTRAVARFRTKMNSARQI